MTIRAVRDDDFSAIAAITNHYIETTSIHFAYEPVTDGALREHWLASRDRYPFLVVEDGARTRRQARGAQAARDC